MVDFAAAWTIILTFGFVVCPLIAAGFMIFTRINRAD